MSTAVGQIASDPRDMFSSSCKMCFALCSDIDIMRFHAHLPVVRKAPSPWIDYLATVYGTPPTLPFDMQSISAFYPGILPTRIDNCTGHKEFAHRSDPLPYDDASTATGCDGYLWETRREEGRPTIIRSFIGSRHTLRSMLAEDPFAIFLGLQPMPRTPYSSYEWVEVLRVGSWTKEDKMYGCWFWPARGSGVFVNLQASIAVSNIDNASRAGFSRNDRMWSQELVTRRRQSMQVLRTHPHLHQGMNQWISPPFEIVLASLPCIERQNVENACVSGLVLRGGWTAKTSCTCQGQPGLFYARDTMHCSSQVQRARNITQALRYRRQ